MRVLLHFWLSREDGVQDHDALVFWCSEITPIISKSAHFDGFRLGFGPLESRLNLSIFGFGLRIVGYFGFVFVMVRLPRCATIEYWPQSGRCLNLIERNATSRIFAAS